MLRGLVFVVVCLSLSSNALAQKVKVTTLYCDGQGAVLDLVGDQVETRLLPGAYYAFQVDLSDPEVVITGLAETYFPFIAVPISLPIEDVGPNRLGYGDVLNSFVIARGSLNFSYADLYEFDPAEGTTDGVAAIGACSADTPII